MRFFLAVFVLALFSSPVLADSMQVWVAEARELEGNCKADPLLSLRSDCRCLANKVFVARQSGNKQQQSALIGAYADACANRPAIAGTAYARCVPLAQQMKMDVESFCKCYANNYASQPQVASGGFHQTQQLMTNAMRACGLGNERAKVPQTKGSTLEDIRRLRGGAISPRMELAD